MIEMQIIFPHNTTAQMANHAVTNFDHLVVYNTHSCCCLPCSTPISTLKFFKIEGDWIASLRPGIRVPNYFSGTLWISFAETSVLSTDLVASSL